MGAPIFSGVIAKTLKNTLESIIDDDTDGVESGLVFPKIFDVSSMSDAYEDDLEMGGPGLAQEMREGEEYATGGIQEGTVTRYRARKFGLRMIISEEAMDDTKYAAQALRLARRLKRALYKSAEFDASNMFNRAFNTSYPIGDGLPLFSASHTLPSGGTFSNTAATPFAPSMAAVIVARAAVAKMPGHDGVIGDNFMLTDVVCPIDQQSAWEIVLGTTGAPGSNVNDLNVAKKLGLGLIPNVFWTATTTSFFFKTDASDGNGLKFKWKKRPVSKTWEDEPTDTMQYSIHARWDRNCSDPRAVYGMQA